MNSYSKDQCLHKDWSNPKEITAEELAWCILEYNLDIDAQELSTKRLRSIDKEIIILSNKQQHVRESDLLKQRKSEIHTINYDLTLDGCTTLEHLDIVEHMLKTDYHAISMVNEHNPREKDYSQHKEAYIAHLKGALKFIEQYDSNGEPSYWLNKLLDVGFPRPYTAKEIKVDLIENTFYNKLKDADLSHTAATTLSKQITKHHFSRK